MSGIGATVGKEPNHIEDGDLKSLDELRGDMKAIAEAKLSMGEQITMEGLRIEVEVVKQQMEMTHEQMRRLIGMYATMADEFEQFRRQRIIELQAQVGGGSTTPEDMNDPPCAG